MALTLAHGSDTAAASGADAKFGSVSRQLPRLKRIGTRYTRFVATMKLVLPVIAGVLVLAVIVWPQLKDEPERFRIGMSELKIENIGGQKLTNARYTGTGANGNPFTVTAQGMSQENKDDDIVGLTNPKADVTLDDGTWLALTAPAGDYSKSTEVLWLSDGVSLFHDAGYEFKTESALVDLASSTAHGQRPVRGQGPFGTLEAAGFRILDRGARIVFTGEAHLVLFPSGRGGDR